MTDVAWSAVLPRFWSRVTGARKRARIRADREFAAALAALRPGDLAVDLGANVGTYTTQMAATGADVVAFEPDPEAFRVLSDLVAGLANVTLIAAAASDANGTMTLYRHRDFLTDPVGRTVSSSLVSAKINVDTRVGVEVAVIDFTDWILQQERPISLLKIDIEGAEVALLERLFDSPALERLGHVFVETHERVIPGLRRRTAALRARSDARVRAGKIRPAFNWDWR